MRRSYIGLAVVVLVVFLSGVAVGQKARTSKLAKYLAPVNVSQLEWMLLQADIVALRDYAGYSEGGIAPARFFFNPKADTVTAFVTVDGNFLNKEPSASVREKLSKRATTILFDLRISIPELSEQNFEVEFKNLVGGGAPVDFAEYKNGKLILH